MCLSANLLTLFEHQMNAGEKITNEPEIKRRAQRLEQAREKARGENTRLPQALQIVQQMTQHTLKFIRWVAAQLWLDIPWKDACATLRTLYAKT